MLVFTLWTNPQIVSSTYEDVKESIGVNEKNLEEDPNIVFIEDKPLKIADPETFTFDRFNDISYSIRYVENETTDFIVVDFKDDSGYLNDKYYRVTHRTSRKDTTLCDESSNKTSGEIYCDIHGIIELGSGSLIGNFHAKYNGHSKVIGLDQNLWNLLEEYWKDKGYLI